MSENKDAETNQVGQATPAPAAQEPAAPTAPKPEAAPAESTAETGKGVDKSTLAHIRQRQENRALKQRIAELEAAKPAPQPPAAPVTPAPVAQAPQAPAVSAPVQPQEAVKAETVNTEAESMAIQAMAVDKDVQSVPGAILDILDIVDSNPKIAKINAIDPALALREAKALWASKLGIAPAPAAPVATKTSGGMSTSPQDLQALFAAVDAAKPGTKAYRDAVAKVNAAMNSRR